ncbi:RelA/SpoT domain-containing protein [Francisellaceae bacterium CB52]
MVIEELELSKKQVKKVGEIFRNINEVSNDDYQYAFDIMSEWRARHLEPLNLAYKLIQRYTLKYDAKAFFGQRLKRAISIIHKLERMPKLNLARMQDIAGCRAIVDNYEVLEKIDNALLKSHSILKDKGKDYISSPKGDGYRGLHRIYKYNGNKSYYKNLIVEIQLRTELQHAWATAVEIIDIFEKESLKIGQGSQDWKRFFYLLSNEFAKLEKAPLIDDNLQLEELSKIVDKLDVIVKMRSYTVFSQVAEQESKKIKDFLLIRLDKNKKQMSWSSYSDFSLAQETYKAMEKEYTSNDDYDLVLIHAHSIKGLRKAYPNYFADSKLFVEKLKEVLQK